MKQTLLFFLITLYLCSVTGCSRQDTIKASGRTIKIGVIGPLSGPDRMTGTDGVEGIRSLMQMHPLLDNGDAVELVLEDDKNDPEIAEKALKKLITEKKVSAILLLSIKESARAVTKRADEYQIPVFALLASDSEIDAGKTYVSQLYVGNVLQGNVSALFVRDELLIDRVAIMYDPEIVHSYSLAEQFRRKFEETGGTVTADVEITEDITDFTGLMKTLQLKETQLLYLPVEAKDFIRIAEALKELHWTPKQMVGDGLFSDLLQQHKKTINLLNNIYEISLFSGDTELTAFGEQIAKNYKKMYGKVSSDNATLGAEGYAILLNAMNRCGKADGRQCINRMLHHTERFEGVMGRISIREDGKVERPLVFNKIKKGRESFLVKVY